MRQSRNRHPALAIALGLLFAPLLPATELVSSTWGFRLDLPEGYEYRDGDEQERERKRYSFADSMSEAAFDMVIHADSHYRDAEDCLRDSLLRLGAEGELEDFDYRGRASALANFHFLLAGKEHRAWALALPLDASPQQTKAPILLAIAHAPVDSGQLDSLHFSALDSLAPSPKDRLAPGPINSYAWPGTALTERPLAGLDTTARFYSDDANANRQLVEREALILARYGESPLQNAAWQRFYRAIYRDAFTRLEHAAFMLERLFADAENGAGNSAEAESWQWRLLSRGLDWVQEFHYERDLEGSDFVDLVTAATEGRGDCDSRAMLLAIVLEHAGIPAHIMVSQKHAHAMALAAVEGPGARFPFKNEKWLVAETTARVGPGRIAKEQSAQEDWLGIDLSF